MISRVILIAISSLFMGFTDCISQNPQSEEQEHSTSLNAVQDTGSVLSKDGTKIGFKKNGVWVNTISYRPRCF